MHSLLFKSTCQRLPYIIASVINLGSLYFPVHEYKNDIIFPCTKGLKKAMSTHSERDKAFETVAFLELRRKHNNIFYWKGKQEVDFCIPREKGLMLINACSDLSDRRTQKREIEGLVEAAKSFSVSEAVLLSSDTEETLSHNNVKIKVIPLWKWLIEKERFHSP